MSYQPLVEQEEEKSRRGAFLNSPKNFKLFSNFGIRSEEEVKEQARKEKEKTAQAALRFRGLQDFFSRANNLSVPLAGLGIEASRFIAERLEKAAGKEKKLDIETQEVLDRAFKLMMDASSKKFPEEDKASLGDAWESIISALEKHRGKANAKIDEKITEYALIINEIITSAILSQEE